MISLAPDGYYFAFVRRGLFRFDDHFQTWHRVVADLEHSRLLVYDDPEKILFDAVN